MGHGGIDCANEIACLLPQFWPFPLGIVRPDMQKADAWDEIIVWVWQSCWNKDTTLLVWASILGLLLTALVMAVVHLVVAQTLNSFPKTSLTDTHTQLPFTNNHLLLGKCFFKSIFLRKKLEYKNVKAIGYNSGSHWFIDVEHLICPCNENT